MTGGSQAGWGTASRSIAQISTHASPNTHLSTASRFCPTFRQVMTIERCEGGTGRQYRVPTARGTFLPGCRCAGLQSNLSDVSLLFSGLFVPVVRELKNSFPLSAIACRCQPKLTGKQPIMMINSFNEWHEGTQVMGRSTRGLRFVCRASISVCLCV